MKNDGKENLILWINKKPTSILAYGLFIDDLCGILFNPNQVHHEWNILHFEVHCL